VTADPSPAAAARRAAALARRTGARVLLLHVVSPEAPPLDFDGLQCELAPLLDGIDVQPLLRHGPPAREILAAAAAAQADLILMTRHGRWQSASELGFSRFLLHSVLCRVLLEADCPVWIEPEEGGGPAEPEHVLYHAVSPVHDRQAIRLAGALAARMGARLVLFRAAINTIAAVPGRQERAQAWQQDVVAAVRDDLENLRRDMDMAADIHVGIGHSVAALLQAAEARPGGLIALRLISREWGSDAVLQPLVRGAHVPVLLYPGAPHPAAPARTPPRHARLKSFLLVLFVLMLGVWAIHDMFRRASQPDCDREAYRCAVRENLMNSVKDRINQPQPKGDPKLGPFSQETPAGASRPPP
jgi:nucleotide-binding universal stress UspA family protein